MSDLHISISAERVFDVLGVPITNSMVTSWAVSLLIIIFAISFSRGFKLKGKMSKTQLLVETVVEGLYNLVISITGTARAKVFFPLVATFFFYIVPSNWTGLLPGAGTVGFQGMLNGKEAFIPVLRAPTADLNTTLALALIAMFFVQFYGFKYQGLSYLKKFFDFTNPINAFVGILELVSDISKVISFTFRLFGNIFAGEVLLAVIAYLTASFLPIAALPFFGLELFVGAVQGLVFMMLATVFINMATISHGDHDEAHAKHK
jgi:F-type H+-transporting ATPase subunit a